MSYQQMPFTTKKDAKLLKSRPTPSFRKKPMNDPDGIFYLDREFLDVKMYEGGLRNDHWNPTQVLYEISSICGWGRPSFVIRDIKRLIFPSFICEVVVKGKSFITERGVAQKKAAQHLASAMVLSYIGFDFNHTDKDAPKSPISTNNLMNTKTHTYSIKPDYASFRCQGERERTSSFQRNRGDSHERNKYDGRSVYNSSDNENNQELDYDTDSSAGTGASRSNGIAADRDETRTARFRESRTSDNTNQATRKRKYPHQIPLDGNNLTSSNFPEKIANNQILEPPASKRKPMDDPKGIFFIDREFLDVRMHEECLRNGTWNPAQSLCDISSKCGWGEPSFTFKKVENKKSIIPCYECDVTIKGKSFYTDKGIAPKKTAQHLASAKALNYFGFEFEYVNKETFKIPIPVNEPLPSDHKADPRTVTSLKSHEEREIISSFQKDSDDSWLERIRSKNNQELTNDTEFTMSIDSRPNAMPRLEETETCRGQQAAEDDTRPKSLRESRIPNNANQVPETNNTAYLHQIPTDNPAISISPLKRVEPDSKRKPLDDPNGMFYIDKELINVNMYEQGLITGKWNPTQALYEISSECDWEAPSFTITRLDSINGQSIFLCNVAINGKYFIPDRGVPQKTMAQHLASAKVLSYIGFEFIYGNGEAFKIPVPMNEQMKTTAQYSDCPRSDNTSCISHDESERTSNPQIADRADDLLDDSLEAVWAYDQSPSSSTTSQGDDYVIQNYNCFFCRLDES